jgi:hypothetical protein
LARPDYLKTNYFQINNYLKAVGNFTFSVQSNISGRLNCLQVAFFGEEMFLKVFADLAERN